MMHRAVKLQCKASKYPEGLKELILPTNLSVQKWLVGATPSTWNFRSNPLRWSEITDFRSLRS